MREIERISPMLEAIEKAWALFPDLQLGQLLTICAKDRDLFYIEDTDLLREFQSYIENFGSSQ
ncbi:hypothetical protein [Roseburia sp. MSJ-14]|uniref:hypothetical protein n=1 Tax=Roseburia sp. MSJ-14 TaxID=2841514 RepID=UPI001C0F6098|nr:hypothetical protein [Roseburia sp. MSJ-14]MBU5473572.1 hypothetical protein [Roseburia sp. MSJ-14]